MGGEKDSNLAEERTATVTTSTPENNMASRVIDFGGSVDYVVVEKDEDTPTSSKSDGKKNSNFVPSDLVVVEKEDAEETTSTAGAPFAPGAFHAVGASLSECMSSASSTQPRDIGSASTRSGSAVQQPRAGRSRLSSSSSLSSLSSSATATFRVSGRVNNLSHPAPASASAPDDEAFHNAHFEITLPPVVVAAIACVYAWWNATRERTSELRQKASVLTGKTTDALICAQRCARRKWAELGPPPPALKRLFDHRMFPVLMVVLLSLVVTLPGYWALPSSRSGQRRVSSREWQEKYEDLQRKYAEQSKIADEYNNLGVKHTSLQEEHEALLNFIKVKERRAARERSLGVGTQPSSQGDAGSSQAGTGSCGKDFGQGPVQLVKETLMAAEKSAYEMFKYFSDGLKEDIHEIAQILRGCDDGTGDRSGHRKGNAGKMQDDEKEKKEESGRNESDVDATETGKPKYLDAESTEPVPEIVARVMGQPSAGDTVEASHLDGPEAGKASTPRERTQAARDVTEGINGKGTAGTTKDTAGTSNGASGTATHRAGMQVELPIHSHMDAWEYVKRAGLGDFKVHYGKPWNGWEGVTGKGDTKSGGKQENATEMVRDKKLKKKTKTKDEKAKKKRADEKDKEGKKKGAAKEEGKEKVGVIESKSKGETKAKKEKGHKLKKVLKPKKLVENKKIKGKKNKSQDKKSKKKSEKKET